MKLWALASLVVGLWSVSATDAEAYTLGSGYTPSCHEEITEVVLVPYLAGLTGSVTISLPPDDTWKAGAAAMTELSEAEGELKALLESERLLYAAYSLLVGLRDPDTQGYAISDLEALRVVHADPSPRAQHSHSLRSSLDVGDFGDLEALTGTRELVFEHLVTMATLSQAPGQEQDYETHAYLDYYGRTKIAVWGPGWNLGRALHTIQDSFSHTIRSSDGAEVLHVLNYVDAFQGDLDTKRGGLAHSTGMDNCERSEVAPLVRHAKERSAALVQAALALVAEGDSAALVSGLTDCPADALGDAGCGWFAYSAACRASLAQGDGLAGTCCSQDTQFCDSFYLDFVLDSPTGPYLRQALGCTWGVRSGDSASLSWICGIVLGLGVLFGRRRRSRLRFVTRATAGGAVVVYSHSLAAQELAAGGLVFSANAHGSLVTDAFASSDFATTFGPTLRGGYRLHGTELGQWGAFLAVEHNYWVRTEYELQVDPGVLNTTLGVEFLYGGILRSALAVGPSVLLFDAGLHDSGKVGFVVDFQPLGFRRVLGKHWALGFDPLYVAWVNPTPSGEGQPSLGVLQYRTMVGVEWRRGDR